MSKNRITIDKVRDWFRDVSKGVRNLIAYAPIIWRDRDWDHGFFLELLQFKLSRMERFFGGNLGHSADNSVRYTQIKACREALDRYLADDYHAEKYAAHRERWGELTCPVCGEFICGCFPAKGGYHLVAIHEKVGSLEDDERARGGYLEILRSCSASRQADLEFVFDSMKDNVEFWWD